MPDVSFGSASPSDSTNHDPRGVGAGQPRQIPAQIGDYQVVKYLSQGGFGEVYQAREPKRGEAVAIKVLRDKKPTAQRIREFEEEAKKLARFDRPGIVRLLKVGHSNDFPCFIVTQFIPAAAWATGCSARWTDTNRGRPCAKPPN